MAEIGFESLSGVLETTRKTAVTPPDHYLNMKGTITPMRELYRAQKPVGGLVKNQRSAVIKKWSALDAAGDLDPYVLPWLLRMAVNGSVSAPTTPVGATTARLFTFTRSQLADNLKSASMYYGDPNQKFWQAIGMMLDQLTIKSDTGSGVAQMGVKGTGQFPSQLVSVPTLTTELYGPLLIPGQIQVWADTSLPIGSTEITGRVMSAEHTINTGVTYKYPGQGPASGLSYHHTGRAPSECSTKVSFEMVDQAEYNLYEGAQQVKLRVRHNGPLIETVSSVDFYNYVQVDMYGTLDKLKWGVYEQSNRSLDLEMTSEDNATAGTDCVVYVQTNRTSI